jgi:carbon storage regulator
MLVLSRRLAERVVIGQNVEVVVIEISGNKVRLGFEAPPDVPIHRKEVHQRIEQEKEYHEDQRGISAVQN